MEDHYENRHVKGLVLKREAMRIGLDASERGLRLGDAEHRPFRIECDDLTSRVEEGSEPAGPRPDIEYPFSRNNAPDLDQTAEPILSVDDRVGTGGVVVLGSTGIVDRHATWKRASTYEASEDCMTVAEFSVTPIGKGASVGTYVARCLEIVDRSGLPYRLNAMGTVVEGEFEDLLNLIGRCHKAVAEDCERVSTIVKIDDRKGVSGQLEAKVKAVEKRLGRKLRT
jgi:uncharacterized protein (TIGR00106 family)